MKIRMNAAEALHEPPMRVCFPYVAELHQVFHSLPIAAELALRHPFFDVRAACATDAHR